MKSSTAGDALCCPEGVNVNQLASRLWGFSPPPPPALLLACLILSQPCQLLTMPEDGFLTPMLQTPSFLLAVGRHPSKLFPSHFGRSSNTRIGANDMWGHEPLLFLHHNYLSHCRSLVGSDKCHHLGLYRSPQVFTEMQWESESAVQGLACPVGLKVWVHMSAPRPKEWE